MAKDWCVLVAAMALAAFSSAWSGGVQGQSRVQTGQRAFDVRAGPLATALTTFGRQAGLQVSVDPALVQGVASPGASGTMAPEEALQQLLAGTGFTYTISSGNTVTLQKPGAGIAPGIMQLGPVRVQGALVPPQAMIDNTPPPFAGGQVATGAQLGVLGNRDIMDAPFNVTAYTARLIRDQQARSIADVVDNDPSVRNVFPRGSGIDQFTIRGFLAPNQDVTFGGLYGMTPSASNSMAMEGVERLEVLKGPSALLNGITPSGNIGGVINVVPKRATEDPITRLTGLYDSVSQFGGRVDVGRRYGDAQLFGIRFNGLYRKGNTPIANNLQETQLATLGMDLRGDRIRASADLGYQYQESAGTPRGIGVVPGVPVPAAPSLTGSYVPPWTFAQQKDAFVVLRGEVDILENLTGYAAFGTKAGWNRFLAGFPTVINAQGNLRTPPFYSTTYISNLTAEAGFRGIFHTGPLKHQVSLGAAGFWQETGTVRSTTPVFTSNLYSTPTVGMPNLGGLPTVPTKTAASRLTSFALVDTLSLADERYQLIAGLRYQRAEAENFNPVSGALVNSFNDAAVTPGFGLIVKPWRNVSLYANYIEALTQGATAPVGAVNVGQIFPPFRSRQVEVGAKIDFGRFAATLALFQIQQPVGILNPVTQIFSIDGEQRNRGIELNVFGEPLDGVRLLGGVMLLDAVQVNTPGGVTDGKVAIGAPVVNLNLGAEWDTPFVPGLTLSGRAIYTSSQYLDAANTQSIPGWARIDAGVRYTLAIADTDVTLRAEILNLFGADYWASTIGSRLIIGTPRTVLLSMTLGF